MSDVVPSVAVAHRAGNEHLVEVGSQWEKLADSCGLFDGTGEFLLSVAGSGAVDAPWVHVRRGPEIRMAQHLSPEGSGESEFVAMSLDGRVVCGVTAEEYEVWVVCRSFEQADDRGTS